MSRHKATQIITPHSLKYLIKGHLAGTVIIWIDSLNQGQETR